MLINLNRFKPEEFPSEKEIDMTDPALFFKLEDYAETLKFPVHPSKAKGALAREYGSAESKHYAIGRLSTAVDFFPECNICQAWVLAVSFFGGVGIYFDTHYKNRKWIMLHGDLRTQRTFWYRDVGVYHTLHTQKDFNYILKRLSGYGRLL